ncbi:metal-dependent hydrolase [Candidatus Woesearchaeota archaeon]|nr:metal-dependent hydrolase [Candidatus Woesearchaeota archaeon]
MPLAVTHVLLTIIIVDLYRDYVAKHKRYFTLHTIFIAGFAGLLPDIDIPLDWILNILGAGILHRTVTHTPIFGLAFLAPAFAFWLYKKHRIAVYFFVTTFGVLLHILLDFLFTSDNSGLMFLYPFSNAMFDMDLLSSLAKPQIAAGIDAIILLLWLWHEEIRHKISDFI